jgi:2-polyprenyl-3-methyl-5-hydroxy-6-metoxy-1,4-benzoquinol methylase
MPQDDLAQTRSGHPERIVPDSTEAGIVALHLKRYVFAAQWAAGLRVLDAACGVGYGSAELSRLAAEVVGVDINQDTVDYARGRYSSPTTTFDVADVTQLPFEDSSFDMVCSFETVEHVDDAPAAVHEAARVLNAEGVYVASTPNVKQTTKNPANPFHTTEYAPADFERLLAGAFHDVQLYGQHRHVTARHRLLRKLDVLGLRRRVRLPAAEALLGSRTTAALALDDVIIAPGRLKGASEIIAVCRNPR